MRKERDVRTSDHCRRSAPAEKGRPGRGKPYVQGARTTRHEVRLRRGGTRSERKRKKKNAEGRRHATTKGGRKRAHHDRGEKQPAQRPTAPASWGRARH